MLAVLAGAVAVLALAAPVSAVAQQAYPASPYGDNSSPYANPYAQPAPPQNGYAQPQYGQPQYAPQQQPYAQQPYAASPYQQQYLSQPAAPVQALSAEDLEQLLAPIALYPDTLLAQILAASTYPAQVAVADQWLGQMRAQGYGSPDQVAAGASAQTTWDPSVKALTAFPDVLDMMNHNLEWTTNLGNAYYNQPQDVMQTVQVLRERAEQAGNLQSTPQEDVGNDQGYIQLAPANPEMVYVPTYDPWDVYGQPISPYPGFSLFGALGNFFGGAPIQYGLGFALAAFDRMPFGWLAWGLDWLGHALLFDHADYCTHSATVADWGLPHGGPRAYYGREGFGRGRDFGYRSYGGQQANNGRDGYGRGNWSNNQTQRQEQGRVAEPFHQDSRAGYATNRSYQQPSYGYAHPALPAQGYNRLTDQPYSRGAPQQSYGYRPQTYPNRAQMYGSPNNMSRPQISSNYGYGYGYGYANRSTGNFSRNAYAGQQAYATRPGFANAYGSYRAPENSNSRAFSSRSFQGYGNAMARSEHSGGFHLFGHSSEPRGFASGQHMSFSGGHAPRSTYKAPRSFGGGHMRAPKMSHSGGGGGHHRF
jgi:hypothetical protein